MTNNPDYTPLIKEIQRLLTLGEEGYKIYIDKLAEKEKDDEECD